MSFIRRLFEKKADDDYETILATLANDIQKRQIQLSEIRLRERRSTLLATLYTLAAWVVYFVIWYLGALPRFGNEPKHSATERIMKGIPVLVGPIIILFIRRIVQEWYTRKGNKEERALRELMKKRRDKVEEVKKKTNYYSTRDLLQKYDEISPGSPAPLLRQRIPGPQPPPVTPQRPIPQPASGIADFQTPSPGLHAQLSHVTPTHSSVPRRRQWYDKLAEAILGDDDVIEASPSSRYALICEKCFTHNGLVKESTWEDAQYLCPKCGHFNQSSRSKQKHGQSPSGLAASHSNSAPRPTAQPVSPASPTSDLPTVDGDDTMSMEVDAVQSPVISTS